MSALVAIVEDIVRAVHGRVFDAELFAHLADLRSNKDIAALLLYISSLPNAGEILKLGYIKWYGLVLL